MNQRLARRAALPVGVAILVFACASPPPESGVAKRDTRAAILFERHCALCHGSDGSGLGPASRRLSPPPRDFGDGRFALVSTRNGVPTRDDLVRTLRRGMPGSAMPPWAWMSDEDLEALAEHVRELAVERMTERLIERARAFGDELAPADARAIAVVKTTPGEVIVPAPPADRDPATLAVGEQLYLEYCAACHRADGRGRQPVSVWRETHDIRLARDFTAGIMKGGASSEELTWRIVAGMPASGMPPTELDGSAHTAALVAFVQGLLPEGADQQLTQTRRTIAARRAVSAPTDPDDPAWEAAAPVDLVLAPLVWHDQAILEARFAALHDGETLALRVTWSDGSRDDRAIGRSRFSDAAALQFSAEREPPLSGMGSGEHPVNIWHWKAFRQGHIAGLVDLLENPPHARFDALRGAPDTLDVPLYAPAIGLTRPSDRAESVVAEGFDTLDAHRGEVPDIDSTPVWRNGVWQVVFRRSLRASTAREIELSPGARVEVGLALWNGSGAENASWKSSTIWHRLQLEP